MYAMLFQQTNPPSWRRRFIALFALATALFCTGCLSSKGVMYLYPQRVGKYLKEGGKVEGANSKTAKTAEKSERARKREEELLRQIPDGDRILGGFCTDEEVVKQLKTFQELQPKCHEKLGSHQSKANLQGVLFWSFLGGTALSGVAMVTAVALPIDDGPKGILAATFGSLALATALINGFGGFDGRQEFYKGHATRIDNYMWTLRLRIVSEVCNAKTVQIARVKLKQIYGQADRFCSAKIDDGTYRPPE